MAGIFDYMNFPPQPAPIMNAGFDDASLGDPKTLSGRIQEWLGAREPNQAGMAQDILSGRFQPTFDDSATGAVQTLLTGKPVSGQNIANERAQNSIGQMSIIKKLQENAGGATGELVDRYMRSTGSDFPTALQAVQTGFRQNMVFGPDGTLQPIPGAASSLETLSHGKQAGQESATLEYAGPITTAKGRAEAGTTAQIEAAKKRGAGEVTDIEKRDTGKKQVSQIVGDVADYYNLLKQKGAAIDVTQPGWENALNRTRSSGMGQFLGKAFGTEEQSIRNSINQQIPTLINAIRQSTGMSAKAMDSNVELKFYLQQASDPGLDIQTNLRALQQIETLYGLGNQLDGNNVQSPMPEDDLGLQNLSDEEILRRLGQ